MIPAEAGGGGADGCRQRSMPLYARSIPNAGAGLAEAGASNSSGRRVKCMMVQREPGIERLAYREYLKTNRSKFEPGRGGGDPDGCPPFLYRFPCRKGNKRFPDDAEKMAGYEDLRYNSQNGFAEITTSFLRMMKKEMSASLRKSFEKLKDIGILN